MFTPKSVGSCFDSASISCAYTAYCAYHGSIGSGTTQIVSPTCRGRTPMSGCDANALWGFGYANGSAIDPDLGVLSDGVHYGSGTTGLANNGLGLYNQVATAAST